jgi:hypothetical protein
MENHKFTHQGSGQGLEALQDRYKIRWPRKELLLPFLLLNRLSTEWQCHFPTLYTYIDGLGHLQAWLPP